jgi:uncharacterized membrane protein YhhN
MFNIWFFITLGTALVDWIAVEQCWQRVIYVAKPGVMVALLAWLSTTAGYSAALLPFYLGLIFSLAGDVFLMLPREQFIPGLVSFLLAHVAYIIGLNQSPLSFGIYPILLALIILLAGWQLFRRIAQGLIGKNRKLRLPVLIYSIVISVMLFSALNTLGHPDWNLAAAMVASLGALLFYLSDVLLAWRKFVRHFPHERLLGIIPYHLGQVALIAGAILQFRIFAAM